MPSELSGQSAAVDRIYEAVFDPSVWPEVLADLAGRAGGSGAMLMRTDVVTGEGDIVLSPMNDHGAWARYEAYYASINPLHNVADPAAYAGGWRPIMLRDEDWMDRRSLEASEYYNDFLRPIDACHGLYLRLALEGRLLTTISLGRGRSAGRFEDASLRSIAPLHGHLIRAAALGRRFAELRRFADGAVAAMDAANDPLLLLDAAGRIVHANSAGERLLAEGTIVREAAGRLAPGFYRQSTQLDCALATAAGPAGPAGRRASSLRLTDRRRGVPSECNVVPIVSEGSGAVAGGPAVLVRIGPVASTERLDALSEHFGLTDAERSLAASLAEGGSLRQAAQTRGISINTARSHLASIFGKTGVHRQAELVSLLTRDR